MDFPNFWRFLHKYFVCLKNCCLQLLTLNNDMWGQKNHRKRAINNSKWIFSDVLASLALMIICNWLTDWLTDWSKLEIGNFACLTVFTPPLSHSIQWEYLSGQFGHPGQFGLVSLVIHLVTLVSLVTICIICTLRTFQFYLAHLWTDFQSCWSRKENDIALKFKSENSNISFSGGCAVMLLSVQVSTECENQWKLMKIYELKGN